MHLIAVLRRSAKAVPSFENYHCGIHHSSSNPISLFLFALDFPVSKSNLPRAQLELFFALYYSDLNYQDMGLKQPQIDRQADYLNA